MKKTTTMIFTFLIVALLFMLALFFIRQNMSKVGNAPGLVSGRLSKCPDEPNCVCSEFGEDESHYVSPLSYPASKSAAAMALMREVITEAGGEIVSGDDGYISATFTSAIFKFVDDLECRNDELAYRIHLRSASRVGRSDLGVNRKRSELISSMFSKKIKAD